MAGASWSGYDPRTGGETPETPAILRVEMRIRGAPRGRGLAAFAKLYREPLDFFLTWPRLSPEAGSKLYLPEPRRGNRSHASPEESVASDADSWVPRFAVFEDFLGPHSDTFSDPPVVAARPAYGRHRA